MGKAKCFTYLYLMKKVLLLFSLFSSLTVLGQKKINEVINVEGEIEYGYSFEGEAGFYLINKKDTIHFYFLADSGDEQIESKVSNELFIDIIAGLIPKGTKLKIKAQAAYGLFSPVCEDCKQFKTIIWKPIEIIRMAK